MSRSFKVHITFGGSRIFHIERLCRSIFHIRRSRIYHINRSLIRLRFIYHVYRFLYKESIYLHAASAAVAPSADAVVSWRTVLLRQSPATKMPGVRVSQRSSLSK